MVKFFTVLVVFVAAVFSINHALSQSQRKGSHEEMQRQVNKVQGKEE